MRDLLFRLFKREFWLLIVSFQNETETNWIIRECMTVYVQLVLSSYFSFFFFFLLKKECSEGWTLNDGSCYWLNKDFFKLGRGRGMFKCFSVLGFYAIFLCKRHTFCWKASKFSLSCDISFYLYNCQLSSVFYVKH